MPVIKIGRNEYTFTEDDVFLDNGSCIQVLTRDGVSQGYARYSPLCLTQKAIKDLEKRCKRVEIKDHPYSGKSRLEVFYYEEEE